MADIIDLIYEDHDWLRRHFFYLDHARTTEELTAVWEPLADRLDLHAEAEEEVFYPALLRRGRAGDPEDETDDAITDHNAIRDAVRAARGCQVGTAEWYEAVGKARTENGEHLDEEEREALSDFIKSSAPQLRHELAMKWLRFYHQHTRPSTVESVDKDTEEYIAANEPASAADKG
jgi:hypothetical protein